MKLMLMWPEGTPETKILFDVLKKEGHEVAYWVGVREGEHLTPKGTVFHDHYDAWDAKPAEALRHDNIEPPGTELITSMFETESLILSMMNKRYDRESVDERKHIYYSMLGYWTYVLDTYKPDWILYAQIPHSLYSNVVYDLARKRGTPTICFEDTWVAHRLLMYRDYLKGNDDLQAALRIPARVELQDLNPEMREYWKRYAEGERTQPAYMVHQKKTYQGRALLSQRLGLLVQALRRGNILSLTGSYVRKVVGPNLKKEYTRFAKKPDWNIPFTYFPMHFQPERTTTPQGGVYHDQILVVETLAAALPKGWEIFVKEHPSQWWLRTKERYSSARYPGYYERLARIPNVRIVPIDTNTFELTERAKTVAVITGTAGWEGLLRGKKPLVFGIPWWRDCPGVFRVDSVESCRTAFRKISEGAVASRDDVFRFLRALEKASIHAYLENPQEENLHISPEENMRTITQRILNEMKS